MRANTQSAFSGTQNDAPIPRDLIPVGRGEWIKGLSFAIGRSLKPCNRCKKLSAISKGIDQESSIVAYEREPNTIKSIASIGKLPDCTERVLVHFGGVAGKSDHRFVQAPQPDLQGAQVPFALRSAAFLDGVRLSDLDSGTHAAGRYRPQAEHRILPSQASRSRAGIAHCPGQRRDDPRSDGRR